MSVIREAVILAAGWGSRVQGLATHGEKISKPLIPLAGEPMIARVMRTLAGAGIEHLVVVTGFLAEDVARTAQSVATELGVTCDPVFNPRWHDLANGVSALAAKPHIKGPFLLSMSDHAYDRSVPERLAHEGLGEWGVRLAVDRKLDTIFDMDDATKVKLDATMHIVNIGKTIADYDAVDVGLFACSGEVFAQLDAARAEKGDCSLSDGMKRLGLAGRFGAMDIGAALWQDVDTPECLEVAEQMLAEKRLRFPS